MYIYIYDSVYVHIILSSKPECCHQECLLNQSNPNKGISTSISTYEDKMDAKTAVPPSRRPFLLPATRHCRLWRKSRGHELAWNWVAFGAVVTTSWGLVPSVHD